MDGGKAFVAGLKRRLATAEKLERVLARSIQKDTDLLATGEILLEDGYLERRRKRLKRKQRKVGKLRALIDKAEAEFSEKREIKEEEIEEDESKTLNGGKKARKDGKQTGKSAKKSELHESYAKLCEDAASNSEVNSPDDHCVRQPNAEAAEAQPSTVTIKAEEDSDDDDDVQFVAQVVPAPKPTLLPAAAASKPTPLPAAASSSACCPAVAVPDRVALLQDALRLIGALLAPQPACCCSSGCHHHEPPKEPKQEPQ